MREKLDDLRATDRSRVATGRGHPRAWKCSRALAMNFRCENRCWGGSEPRITLAGNPVVETGSAWRSGPLNGASSPWNKLRTSRRPLSTKEADYELRELTRRRKQLLNAG